MIKIFVSTIALLFFCNSLVLAAEPLAALKGEKNVLLLFSKSRSDATLDRQVDLLRDYRSNLRERDMIVLRTSGREETRAVTGYTRINRGMARELRQEFKPAAKGLTVVLVSKQGEEITRWQQMVSPPIIFDVLDEIKKSKNAKKPEAENAVTVSTN